MDYKEIPQYYGKTALIYHSIGVLMFDDPVQILPEKDQGKDRRYYLHVRDGKEERFIRVHAIGKIEEVA